MKDAENVKPALPGGMPTWDETAQHFKIQAWLRVLIGVVVVLWLVLIAWVMFIAPITKATVTPLEVGANLTLVLAPVLAAATAVERTLESLFNMVEESGRKLVAYLGRGLRWLKSAETEVQQARQFLADVSDKYNTEMRSLQIGQSSVTELTENLRTRIDAANSLMALAQKRLTDAENNLSSLTSSDSYISAKAAISIILGLMLGVIIATIGQMQMFALLGISAVPARFDVFITGLAIGSGSYPVHSLVGILQQGKDALDSAKGYFDRINPKPKKEEETPH